MIATGACLEAQTRPLPKPTKVRVVSIVIEPSLQNQPPTVSAGSDQTITLPAPASLKGTASDDGRPGAGSLTQTWSKVSGPGTVTFANVNVPTTTANCSAAGTYVLRLSASDGVLSRTDDVTIIVQPAAAAAPFTMPQAYVDTTYVPPTGQTITVGAGGNFQAALDKAQPGDVITLAAGASYSGPFTLPVKSGAGYIVVRSSAADTSLPPAGTRITPAARNLMPRIVGPAGSPALQTAPGAHHFRFIAVEFAPANGIYIDTLIRLGIGDETNLGNLPHHLIFDRCFIHGDAVKGGKRGVGFNGASLAVVDSYLSDWKGVGQDTQAIAGWNGPGPFKIINNYLEAAGENIMFGGADATVRDLVPSDIEIRGNHFFKPLSWKVGHPSYAGTHWSVKNLLELKNARRVLITDNLLENCWADSQVGFAVVFTVRNQSGTNPWAVVSDVTFTRNVIRNSANGINMLGYDNESGVPSQYAKRLLLQHNLIYGIGSDPSNGDGIAFQILSGYQDVKIDHNTAIHTGNIISADVAPNPGFVFTNNISVHNRYGILGSNYGVGKPAIDHYFPGADIRKNVIVMNVEDCSASYPGGNYFPSALKNVGFVSLTDNTDLRLTGSSTYHNAATDGSDVGANTLVQP